MYKKFSARTTPFPHSYQKNLLEQTPAETTPTLWYPPCCQSCSGSVGDQTQASVWVSLTSLFAFIALFLIQHSPYSSQNEHSN